VSVYAWQTRFLHFLNIGNAMLSHANLVSFNVIAMVAKMFRVVCMLLCPNVSASETDLKNAREVC